MTTVVVVLLILLAAAGSAFIALRRSARRGASRGRSGGRKAAINIDPFTLGEPWRRHVSSAQSTQRRYNEIVAATAKGPLQERLTAIGRQVHHAIEECWTIAKRGDQLDDSLKRLNTASLRTQLERSVDETTRLSLRTQIESSDRIRANRDQTNQQLRLLNIRMGELVAQAAEVSVGSHTTESLGSAIDDVVTQLEALRLAVEDVEAMDSGRKGTPGITPTT